jgi:hypothetical protein
MLMLGDGGLTGDTTVVHMHPRQVKAEVSTSQTCIMIEILCCLYDVSKASIQTKPHLSYGNNS